MRSTAGLVVALLALVCAAACEREAVAAPPVGHAEAQRAAEVHDAPSADADAADDDDAVSGGDAGVLDDVDARIDAERARRRAELERMNRIDARRAGR